MESEKTSRKIAEDQEGGGGREKGRRRVNEALSDLRSKLKESLGNGGEAGWLRVDSKIARFVDIARLYTRLLKTGVLHSGL